MNRILVLFFLIASINLSAQTGIGTTTPHASAKLEVNAIDKGFLPPRVQLTATNSSSPITNPANGLLVFNTVTAGANPFQVVPGYYYWDGTGLKWVSLSTTVGNVQNQAIFRSTSNTVALNAISTWSTSFNNIASGDLTVSSSTNFALSNGIYKIEWALPYQPTGTYNDMLLQENISGTWSTFRGSDIYARIANGGTGNWGGTTFAADVVDCTSSSRTFRLYNADGSSRTLYAGATFIITKLNPSITTSTTADNLGNHIATNNLQLNGNFLSNDGGNEGIRVDNSGNVGIGTNAPTSRLNIAGGGVRIASGLSNTSTRPSVNTSTIGNYEIRGVGGGASQNDGQDDGFLRLSAGGGTNAIQQSSIDLSGFSATVPDMISNIVMRTAGVERLRIDASGNINITGKLDVGDPTGNVVIKAAGFVGRGTDITLGNLKVRFAASGNMSLQVSSSSGTISTIGSDQYITNGSGSTTILRSVTTSPIYLWPSGINFVDMGNSETCILIDTNTKMSWRIIGIVGPGYLNNFISIERLF